AATAPQAVGVGVEWPEAAALLAALLDQPAEQSAVAATLDLLGQHKRDDASRAMPRLRQLADASPRLTSLQLLAAEVHLEYGEPAVAAQLAGRVMRAHP